jgi:hypothetical protein
VDIRNARTLGTLIGALIFIVPMALIWISIATHDYGNAEPGKGRESRRDRGARGAGIVRRAGPGRSGAEAAPREEETAGPRGADADTAPLGLSASRRPDGGIDVALRNQSGRKLRLVVPGGPGRAVTFVPAGGAGPAGGVPEARPAGPVFEPKLDAVIELLPGASYTCLIRGAGTDGPVRAVYDSRGEGLPEGAWSGRAVSDVIE